MDVATVQTAVLKTDDNDLVADTEVQESPIVIIGTGPVGMKIAQELLRRSPGMPIVQYGAEPWMPYNRVKLSSLLAGEISEPEILTNFKTSNENIIQHHNCAIKAIDRANSMVIDSMGNQQVYRKLILAVGSSPHIPAVPGINNPNIFTFRNLSDTQQLLARRVRSRRTVVIGGGLLGLEAAKAMQKNNTEVIVVEHNARLLLRQLDETAAELLREHLLAQGLRIYLKSTVKKFEANGSNHYIYLSNGKSIVCDTIIVATGIKPNTDLALNAGLHVGRGIKVNDYMQTSDPDIYAVGECIEHNGEIYGLVAPGMEQASVAACHISGDKGAYRGSVSATQLKVVDKNVFSMGVVGDDVELAIHKTLVYHDSTNNIYRCITLKHYQLVGAVALGPWAHTARLQEMIPHGRKLSPWQLFRFKKSGELWNEDVAANVNAWPARAIICNCTGVTRGEITDVIEQGVTSIEEIAQCTGASSVCGSCRSLVCQLANSDVEQTDSRTIRKPTAILAVLGLVLALCVLGLPSVSAPLSVQQFSINFLWEDSFWKQVTGYTMLGLSIIGLVMSLRKRLKINWLGDFNHWRMLHIALGVLMLTVLGLHTGLQLGSNLNLTLILTFMGVALTGSLAAAIVALEARLAPASARRARSFVNGLHLVVFWPLPVLLAFHIVSFYYF